eukprot:g34392.t1
MRGIENCPENSDLHNNYGVFLVDRGNGNGASGHYLHAIRLNPKHYVAMVNLGRLLRSANKNKEAETWYKRYCWLANVYCLSFAALEKVVVSCLLKPLQLHVLHFITML